MASNDDFEDIVKFSFWIVFSRIKSNNSSVDNLIAFFIKKPVVVDI